jgi:hypothetical protein
MQLPQTVHFECRREVLAVARNGRVMGTAEFIERVLLVPLQPWQVRLCNFVDDHPKQG